MNEIFKKDYYAFYGESWRIRGGVKRLRAHSDTQGRRKAAGFQ